MKRIISICLVMLTLISVCASASAATYIGYGDFKLAINGDSYLLGGYTGSSLNIVAPSEAYGKPVVGIADSFYEKCSAAIETIVIPEGYQSVGSYAFYACGSLKSVVLPSTVTSVGTMAFGSCTALETADFSAASQLKAIPYGCFSGDTALASATMPDSAETYGDFCFNGCSALSEVNIPYGTKTIGERAFNNASSLTALTIPATVSSIGAYAFYPEGIEGNSLVLSCKNGTYSANYAYENFLNLNALSNKGDADGNGVVDINDVTFIQLYRLGLADFEYYNQDKNADTNGDNSVTIRDATTIQLALAGLIEL